MEDKPGLISEVAGQLQKLCYVFLTILALACAVLVTIGPSNWTRTLIDEQRNAQEWYVHALNFQAQAATAASKAKSKSKGAVKSSATPVVMPTFDSQEPSDPGFEKVIATLNSKEFAAVHPGRESQITRTAKYLQWDKLNLKEIRAARSKALERAGNLSTAKLPFVDFEVNLRDFTASVTVLLSVLILGLLHGTGRLRLAIELVTEAYTAADTKNLRRELVRAGLKHKLMAEGLIRYQGCPVALVTAIAASVFCALLAYFCLQEDGAMWQFLLQNPGRAWLTAGCLLIFATACGFAVASQFRRLNIAPKVPEPTPERERTGR